MESGVRRGAGSIGCPLSGRGLVRPGFRVRVRFLPVPVKVGGALPVAARLESCSFKLGLLGLAQARVAHGILACQWEAAQPRHLGLSIHGRWPWAPHPSR